MNSVNGGEGQWIRTTMHRCSQLQSAAVATNLRLDTLRCLFCLRVYSDARRTNATVYDISMPTKPEYGNGWDDSV